MVQPAGHERSTAPVYSCRFDVGEADCDTFWEVACGTDEAFGDS